jgi:fused signal recognition particle receptor
MTFDHPRHELDVERPGRAPAAENRFDAAHVRADQIVADRGAGEEPSRGTWIECIGPAAAQHMRLQAEQLAAHLARQQTTIDHRESELNARVAAMENQVRSARLWLDERHAELAAQAAELARRERELADREGAITNSQRPGSQASDESARTNEREPLEEFAEPEPSTARERVELDHQRHELADARSEFTAAMKRDREKLAHERRRFAAEQEHAHQELMRRADDLAARQAALEGLRADVLRAQRETLELRLATEELWARLSSAAPPAATTQTLAQIRLELAEEQRLARDEREAERAELETLAAQVAAGHERLVTERAEIQAWARARHAELERSAERLSARERDLSERRAKWEDEAAAWRDERFRLEQEVRRLARQLKRGDSVAA